MAKVEERLIAQVWKRQLVAGERLVTDAGEKVLVIDPGVENKDSGPDFRGAVIATADGGLLNGDIELHLRASDWRSHGHHRDPRYNQVILHVVWDGAGSAVLENGKTVPMLKLCHLLKGSLTDVRRWARLPLVPAEPCHRARQRLGDSEVARLLDEAGEERFQLKADRFEAMLATELPGEVLYKGLMGALGYSKNKQPMEELTRRLPLAVLEVFCQGKTYQQRLPVLKALLLGQAGLLPLWGDGELEAIWRDFGLRETMDLSCWQLFRVRPGNSPTLRLVGAAHLLSRLMDRGLVQSVLDLVARSCPGMGWRELETGFTVSTGGLGSERALIGQGRVREIVINIALPFTFAWARASSNMKLAEHVWYLYRSYPKAGENEITRRLAKLLGGDSALINSARRQQGLIHLDKTFCGGRRCADCPLACAVNPCGAYRLTVVEAGCLPGSFRSPQALPGAECPRSQTYCT